MTGAVITIEVQAGRLVGIVTEADVMRLFVKALGAGESWRPCGTIDPRPAIAALVGRGYAVKTAGRGGAPADRVA